MLGSDISSYNKVSHGKIRVRSSEEIRETKQIITRSKVMIDVVQGADKSLARPGRKQATATEDFEFHISYL